MTVHIFSKCKGKNKTKTPEQSSVDVEIHDLMHYATYDLFVENVKQNESEKGT